MKRFKFFNFPYGLKTIVPIFEVKLHNQRSMILCTRAISTTDLFMSCLSIFSFPHQFFCIFTTFWCFLLLKAMKQPIISHRSRLHMVQLGISFFHGCLKCRFLANLRFSSSMNVAFCCKMYL